MVVAVTASAGQGTLTNKDSEFPGGEAGPLPWGEKQGMGAGPVADCTAGRPGCEGRVSC